MDRNNQTTLYSYDHLNRLQQVTFNDGSSIVYNYDAGNRIYFGCGLVKCSAIVSSSRMQNA